MKSKMLIFLACCGFVIGIAAAEEPMETQPSLYREMTKFSLANERRAAFERAIADLDGSSKQSFWKIYEDYEKDKKELDETRLRLLDQYTSNAATLTDDQVSKIVIEAMSNQTKEINLRKTY